MSLLDSIDALITDTVTVTRHAAGSYTNGIYSPGTTTTFQADIVLQPAFGINRVVGGADLLAHVDNQHVTDIRILYTRTFLKTRTPSTDPDVLTLADNTDWTVVRVEKWDLSGQVHYRCVVTKVTEGAS